MMRKQQWAIIIFSAMLLTIDVSAAIMDEPLVYAIIVGNNDGLSLLPQLHYADDDALRFYRLATRLAPEKNVALLTELDVDTWRRIQISGSRPPPFLPPTKKQLLGVFQLFKKQIALIRQANPRRPVHFYFFFSGHGEQGYFLLKKDGNDLTDSVFTGIDLQRTFADSLATFNGLFIDACKSQSLFGIKGQKKQDSEIGPNFDSIIKQLEQTPAPIGVITSTANDSLAMEARDIQGGYFSHILTSGFSGAADANSDGIISYDELAAFVSFYTRRDAGQIPWFRPPHGRMNFPLVNLKDRGDLIEIVPGLGGHFAIFDANGQNLLLEVHKSETQWTRLILPPGRYKVLWIKSSDHALLAPVDLSFNPQKLLLSHFTQMVTLRLHKRKGNESEALTQLENNTDSALQAFDPSESGFDQPVTERMISMLQTAYRAGRTYTPVSVKETYRHFLSLGYGLFSAPVEPSAWGHGVSFGYSYRLQSSWQIGGRILFTSSEHQGVIPENSFRLYRLITQPEITYNVPLGRYFELGAGAYLGWQMAFLAYKQKAAEIRSSETTPMITILYSDAAGFRAGGMGYLRANILSRIWFSMVVSWGMELLHQRDDNDNIKSIIFLRPQVIGQIGYAF